MSDQNIANANQAPDQELDQTVVHPLETKKFPIFKNKLTSLISVLVILLIGTATGYLLSKNPNSPPKIFRKVSSTSSNKTSTSSPSKLEAGLNNDEDFPDQAEGLLEVNDGSVTWEGTHQLIREGGSSQTVYLTSSLVDLTKFEGQRVQIKGETFTGQTAGWFMDVGWVKVVK